VLTNVVPGLGFGLPESGMPESGVPGARPGAAAD
jgi:hypothetical protein